MKRHVDVDDYVNVRNFVESLSLRYGPRKSVEKITVFAVVFLESFLDYLYRHLVGNELSFIDIGLSHDPDGCSFFDVASENITRGNMGNIVFLGKSYGLRTFSRAGRA